MRRIGWVAAVATSTAGAAAMARGYAQDSTRHAYIGLALLAVGLTTVQDLRSSVRAADLRTAADNAKFAAALATLQAEAESCCCHTDEPARDADVRPFRTRANGTGPA